MNKKFTKLMAALALLTFLAVPMGMWGETTYEQLTSIANIDENAQYVLGIDGTGFHYSGTSSWGLTALPSAQTPIYYTLTKASDGNSFTAQATIGNTTYYLQVPTSNTFSMATSAGTNTDLIIGTTQVSGTNYAVANKTTTARHLRINGTSGLRSYAGTTGTMAFFYKVSGTSMSVSPASIDFGNENTINPNEPYTRTFNVTFANLTESLSVNVGSGLTGVSVSPTSIAANATSPQTVTVSYNPTAEGNLSGNITVSSSEVTTASVSVSGSAYDPANVRYYEKVTEASSNWSGEYIFTGINSSNYYALTGVSSSLGTATLVTVTENGIKSTPTTDGYKVTIAQTTNGYSLYLAGAGYLYYTGSSNALYAAQTFTANTCEWTFSFANGVATITNVGSNSRILQFNYNSGNPRFACYGNSNQTKITLFKYNDPNKVKAPTFSPEGGIYTAAQNVTISSETSGASIYYTTDGSTPTTESTLFNGAFMVSTTTTVKAIAVKNGMTDSDVASTTYTFVTPFTTMQQVYEDAVANTSEHEVYITFNNWVITGTNGSSASQFYLTDPDNTYGCVIYGSGSGFTRGNTLNGTVKCKLLYFSSGSAYSFAEIKELTTQTAGLTIGTGGSVTPITTTIDALTSEKTGTVVKLENLTYNGTVLTDNNNNIINNSNYIYSATLSTDKTYNITGVFTYAYAQNNTPKRICPRSADDIEEVVVPSVTVTPNTINAPFAGAEGTLTLAYENIEEFISFDYYFCDANGNELEDTDPDYPGDWIYAEINDENDAYTLSYIIDANNGEARTAYMKVYTFDDNEEEVSAIVTVNQAKYVVDYATLPFEFNGGKDAIEETNGLTQSGLGSDYAYENTKLRFDNTDDYVILKINERPGILTFYIKGNSFSYSTFKVQTSADGVSYSDLATYTTFGNNETFEEVFDDLNENVRYIKWVYTEKVSGNVGLGNINLAEYVAPQPYDLTVTLNDNVSAIYVFDVADETNPLIEDGAAGTIQVLEGKSIMVSPDVAEGYVLATLMVNNENVISQLDDSGAYTFTMPAETVTITATAVEAPVTDDYEFFSGNLVEGDYIIYYNGYVMKNTSVAGANRLGFENETPSSSNIISTADASIVWHIAQSGDYWTIYNADVNMYAASTGSKNQAQMLDDGTDDKALWTVTVKDTGTYEFVNKKNSASQVNANLRNNGTNGWACYSTQTGGALSLYKKVEPAYTLTINAHTTDGGWYLIASPVAVNPANVDGMTIENPEDPNYSDFDLYYFDQTGGQNGKEWKNYKANHFDLELGKGYLYANANTVDLTFTGVMNGDFEDVDLPYDADDDIKSLYLAGNSKTMAETFYVYDGNLAKKTVNFLTINETGDGFITTSSNEFEAAALQGFFVQSAGEGWTLSTADKDAKSGTPELLNVMVSQNRGALIDNAIVSFGNAPLMSKFYLSDNSTRVFIQQNGEEMAVVRTEAQGEMPVNFRAAENGTYTLTVNPEGVEMNYLHLIDNMTGADIDLLAATSTGSVATYTFNATTRDYESRFRLVFAANNEDGVSTGSTAFAFYSNGTWVINNTGEATLQVVDVNGRILSNETVNGSVSKAINAPAGVYMLRLINGNDVKTQKIVVR